MRIYSGLVIETANQTEYMLVKVKPRVTEIAFAMCSELVSGTEKC